MSATTYRDLISFDPIESVVQLREANARDKAESLVKSFAVSDRMADQFGNIVVPQLQFDKPADNKGLLIVGNYGTGKSHLMAVLSSVAEHEGLAAALTHASARKAAQPIAGRFKVLRAEIGGVKMSLRDIICSELERGLAAFGVEYRFKSVNEIANHKDAFHELNMALDGSVELRVRAVLEEKLARILEEFGSDKVSDVLDSEMANVDFEETYARALLAPDAVDALVDDLTSKIRQQFADARTTTGLFTKTAVDRDLAEKVATSQLPKWVERMTTAFLQAQQHRGGEARQVEDGWHLQWPDGSRNDAVVFRGLVRDDAVETITLEDPRVRGILGELGPWTEARPAKGILIPGMSDKVAGAWSLWRVTLQHGESFDQQFVPVFLEEGGRALQPTARLVWDRLIERGFTFGLGDAVPFGEDLLGESRAVAEERGADVIAGMVDTHRAKVSRDRRAGERAFGARRRAIERLGLPQVRQKRLADLAIELERWGTRLREDERTVSSLDLILMVRVLRDVAGA